MDAVAAKIKKAPTAAQEALAQKKAIIREILKAELAKMGLTYKLGMNAQGVAGYDIGLRGEDLLSFVLDRREHAPAKPKKEAMPAKSKKEAATRKPGRNIMNEINAILNKIKLPTKTHAKLNKTAAAVKKPTKNEMNAMLVKIKQKVKTMKAATPLRKKLSQGYQASSYPKNAGQPGIWKKYNYTRKNEKNAEIADLKAQIAQLKRRCGSVKSRNRESPTMVSPPRREKNNENLMRFFEEEED